MIELAIERARSILRSKQSSTRPDVFEMEAALLAEFIVLPLRVEYDIALRGAIKQACLESARNITSGHGEVSKHLWLDQLCDIIDCVKVEVQK